ncbi:hypothetical protein Tco_0798613 [Tanacetum coccineum]
MAVLESCPKHNMVAYLEKTDGNAEFHEIIDFLARTSIHNALTVSPVVSTIFVEQFWMSAKSKIINNVRYITARVAVKPVSISESSIRSGLLFDDADGIDSLPNQAIFDAIQLMGYEGDLTILTFNKALFSPQWRFLFHTINHCISSKSTSWDQIPTNIATALKSVPVPLDRFLVNALTSKVFSFMVKKGKHFSGKVTPLFSNMLVQPTEDEGEQSERPFEPQLTPFPPHPSEVHVEPQSEPSPRPSPTTHIPDSIPESPGGNYREQVKTQKIQAGVPVSRLKDKDVIFSIGSTLEDFILFVFILVRNIVSEPVVPPVHAESTDELRALKDRAETAKTKRTNLCERVRSLEISALRLQDTLRAKREAYARIEQQLGFVNKEWRQSRMAHFTDRESLRRMETFLCRRFDYRP